MYLLIILTVIFVASVIAIKSLHRIGDWELLLMGVILFSGIGVLIMVIMLGVMHLTADSAIAQYEIVKETIEVSREDEMSELERATLTQTIIETNKGIASNKYWNETSFDLFIPDELAKLDYLK